MIWPDRHTAKDRRRQFAASLDPNKTSKWSEAFAEVPRHVFVPSYHQMGPNGQWHTVRWGDEGYLDTVYSDQALPTQLGKHGIPTSSSSEPSLMLAMLEALDAHAGDDVYELGTGTGYNACLLAHRVGDAHVTSMDIDPMLVEHAKNRCRQAGYAPRLCIGDAVQALARHGPYAKTIATFGLRNVPPTVLGQAAEDAVLVLPIGYGVARLTCHQPGHAQGGFLPRPAFFLARRTTAPAPDFDQLDHQPPEHSAVPPTDVLDRLRFPLSLALPGLNTCSWRDDEGALTTVGLWDEAGAVATCHTSGAVRQAGPRRLWDVIEKTAQTFPHSTPQREDFGITVTPTHQHAWYGDPAGPSWKLWPA